MSTTKPIATLLVSILMAGGLGSAQAQPRQVVHPRSLITQVEIAEYRRVMKAAPTPEAKRELRNATYARLRQRASERGMVMAEPNPWVPGMHWGESHHNNPAAGEGGHMAPRAP